MTNDLFPVVLLAGGMATRLQPLTENTPKALIEINGQPFISHQLRLLKKNNINRVVICTGHLGEQIKDYVGDGAHYELAVSYVDDGAQLLGTGGAIAKALPYLGENFFILYGDSYLLCDYEAVQHCFINSQKLALMTVFKNNGFWDASNIEFKNGKIITYDKKAIDKKMQYIDFGLGVAHRDAFAAIPKGAVCDLTTTYQCLLQKKQLVAYEVKQRFYEIGSMKGIQALSEYLSALEVA